jgi:TrmH family RNA methyltransferase
MEEISSKHNPRIKSLVRLHTSRGRQQQNRIAIFGSREIVRALQVGVEADGIFVCSKLLRQGVLAQVQELVPNFAEVGVSISEELFSKVSFGDRGDGIVMTAIRPNQSLELLAESCAAKTPLLAVVESIEKPGNLGAILRSADGAGIDGVIVADPLTDWFHPNTIRSSLATCFSVNGCVANSDTVQQWLVDNDFQIVAASLDGASDFFACDLTGKTAIVLGNEANGLSSRWQRSNVLAARLPMLGLADSLNVSAAAAVMFYEARRQRML